MDNSSNVEDKVDDKVDDKEEAKVDDKEEAKVDDKVEEPKVGMIYNAEGKLEEPKVGMLFYTIDEVKEYYSKYGDEMGFPVRNRTSKKDDDGELMYVLFACSRQGKAKSTSKHAFRRRPSNRTDCKAKLSASIRPDGKWQITSLISEHNHEMNPGNSCLNRWSKKKVAGEADGSEIVSIFERDSKKHIGKVKRSWLGQGDAGAIQDYFRKMQANNSNFFYMMDLNDEGRLRNVFWADARNRAAYEDFGDAVTFDTTYLTNNYDLPFAPFLGVNHHGQSILLGCGLLSSEDTETFTWLFQCWLACMSGCAPRAIITDQDTEIQKAIEIVFPNTCHRWCLGHIIKKLAGKLKGHKQYESIMFELQNAVYDSLTRDEFEEHWNKLIQKNNLESNEWLLGLYDERHRWAPVFLKDTFWAGMSTSQRGESLHVFFDGYVNSKTTIRRFVEQYEKAMRSKVEKEVHEDLKSFSSSIPCITHYAMEKQFQDAYTTIKFKEFQHELTGKIYCALSSVKKDIAYSDYEISEDLRVGETDRRATFKVSLTHNDCDIHCSCCLFESRGIVCRHAIVVLIHNKILRVPEKYILPRWRKDLKRHHAMLKNIYGEWSGKPEARRFDEMCNAFNDVADLTTDSEDKTQMVMEWINELKKELKRNVICSSSQPAITMNDGINTIGGDVLSISPSKRKQSKTVQVPRKNKEKQKRMGSKRKTITNHTMQEAHMIEGDDDCNVEGAIFGTQESIDCNIDGAIFGTQESIGFKAQMIPFWRSAYGMDTVSNSIGMFGINDSTQPSNFIQPMVRNLQGDLRPRTGN